MHRAALYDGAMKSDSIVKAPARHTLKREQKLLLAEAQRRGREAMERAEGALAEFGQWVFANVFLGETQAVLDREPGDNDLYRALMMTAGSEQMPIARGSLSAALRVAAYDKRLADAAWSRLRFSHKEKLLVLAEPNAMRAAARHVLAASLDVNSTREYVAQLLGEPTPTRITPARAAKAALRASKPFLDAQHVSRWTKQLASLDPEERAEVASTLKAARTAINTLLEAVRAKK